MPSKNILISFFTNSSVCLFFLLEQGGYRNEHPDDIHDHGRVGMVNEGIDGKEDTANQVTCNVQPGRTAKFAIDVKEISARDQHSADPADDFNQVVHGLSNCLFKVFDQVVGVFYAHTQPYQRIRQSVPDPFFPGYASMRHTCRVVDERFNTTQAFCQ